MSAYPLTDTRLAALRARMEQTGTDLVALGPSSHMAWLTGVHPHGDERPVMLMVSADYAGFLMPALNAAAARQDTDLPFHCWSDDQGPEAALEEVLAACGATRADLSVVLDETMRSDFSLRLLAALETPRHRFTEDTVGLLRTRKDDQEAAAIKAAHLANDTAVKAAFNALAEGVKERDIVEIIKAEYAALGATLEFCSVCFGASSAFPHHTPGETRLEREMAVLIDTGCRLDGYPSDMTRCGYFGTPTGAYEEVFAVVEQAVQAALAAAKPGARASDVDKARATSSQPQVMATGSCTAPGTGLGLISMNHLTSPPIQTACWRSATSFPLSPASIWMAHSVCALKRSSFCATAAQRCFRRCRETCSG